MSYKFIDYPKEISEHEYKSAIKKMVDTLHGYKSIKSIYQIGSVSSLGISDVDMFVIFEDGVIQGLDPIKEGQANKYLFTHQLYGTSLKYWSLLRQLTFFHNYKHLFGEVLPEDNIQLDLDAQLELKRQIALEFLIKMYYTLSIQLTYKIVKLRTFLLEGKALIYDLDFLGINTGRMFDLVQKVITYRANWFKNTPSNQDLQKLISELYVELEKLLIDVLANETFYLPSVAPYTIASNLKIINSEKLAIKRKGFKLPNLLPLSERKLFNLHHRFNYFTVCIPYSETPKGSVLQQRFDLLSTLREYNQHSLPHFLIPASSFKFI